VAGNLGFCGLDRLRAPLTGEEIRPCWDGAPEAVRGSSPSEPGATDAPPSVPAPQTGPTYGLFADPDS